jgi:hypothetical protein
VTGGACAGSGGVAELGGWLGRCVRRRADIVVIRLKKMLSGG